MRIAEIWGGRYQRNVKIRTLWGGFVTIFPTGVVVGFDCRPPEGVRFFWNSPNLVPELFGDGTKIQNGHFRFGPCFTKYNMAAKRIYLWKKKEYRLILAGLSCDTIKLINY